MFKWTQQRMNTAAAHGAGRAQHRQGKTNRLQTSVCLKVCDLQRNEILEEPV